MCPPVFSPKLRLSNNSSYHLYAFNPASRCNTKYPPCYQVYWTIRKYVCIPNSYYATILFSFKFHYLTLSILFKSLSIAHSLILSNGNSRQQNTIFPFWNVKNKFQWKQHQQKICPYCFIFTPVGQAITTAKNNSKRMHKPFQKTKAFMAFLNKFVIYLQQLQLKKLILNLVVTFFL